MNAEALNNTVLTWMENTPFFLVEINISSLNEIVVEFESETDLVTIEDCVSLTQFIESNFDREEEDYALEVSSAGLGYPFKVLKQYIKHIGQEVEVTPKSGKKVTGILLSAGEKEFMIESLVTLKKEGSKRPEKIPQSLIFTYDGVKSTRYVIRF